MFDESVLPSLKGVAKALYSHGRVAAVHGDEVIFAVENEPTRERAERSRRAVESALSARAGRPTTVRLVTEAQAAASGALPASAPAAVPAEQQAVAEAEEEAEILAEVDQLEVADVAVSGVERLTQAFPGAQLVDPSADQEPY